MKKFNDFVNEVLNLSKVRKFPENEYEIYDLSKAEIGKYLNTWFVGDNKYMSDFPQNKVKLKRGEMENKLLKDEMWTVKKVDTDTAYHLYNRIYNPVSIVILRPITGVAEFQQNDKGEDLYNMKGMIHSIDDSSYGIWWDNLPLSELNPIREKLMNWINEQDEINGEEFFDACIENGADPESKDYN